MQAEGEGVDRQRILGPNPSSSPLIHSRITAGWPGKIRCIGRRWGATRAEGRHAQGQATNLTVAPLPMVIFENQPVTCRRPEDTSPCREVASPR